MLYLHHLKDEDIKKKKNRKSDKNTKDKDLKSDLKEKFLKNL